MAICAIPGGVLYYATKDPRQAPLAFLLVSAAPVCYAALTFMPYVYLIDDQDLGPLEALAASREITRGNKFSMLGVVLSVLLLYLGGILICFVGAIFMAPYVALSFAVMYLNMSGRLTETADSAAAC